MMRHERKHGGQCESIRTVQTAKKFGLTKTTLLKCDYTTSQKHVRYICKTTHAYMYVYIQVYSAYY